MPRPLLYFGHPVNSYNTEVERLALKAIAETFTRVDIENPNQPHHDENYALWKKHYGNGMNYYYQQVLPKCWAGIFLTFPDGVWGSGVYGEAEFFANNRSLVWKMEPPADPDGLFRITPVTHLNLEKKLTIEETRARIKLPY